MPFTSLLLVLWAHWDRPREYPASAGRLAETWHHWQAVWLPKKAIPRPRGSLSRVPTFSPVDPAKSSECVRVRGAGRGS